MATVSHKDLTGADLHEPKGTATAASGTVYVANGAGSGAWTTLSSLTAETGRIAMYATPVAPVGWLECDGSSISRTTYAALFAVLTIQQTGTRTNGSPTLTALADVSAVKPGYYVGGTGITNGTTVLSTGAGSITMSANATSSGSSTVIVSPFPLGNGSTTFTIPNLTDTGRFPRARTSSVQMGVAQSNQNKAHAHVGSSSGPAGNHTHTGDTFTESNFHVHPGSQSTVGNIFYQAGGNVASAVTGGTNTSNNSPLHTHALNTVSNPGDHSHSLTIASDGGAETRPDSIVFMFCIRT